MNTEGKNDRGKLVDRSKRLKLEGAEVKKDENRKLLRSMPEMGGKRELCLTPLATPLAPLHGGRGNDILKAGAGNDHLWGGEGADQLYGEVDNDTIAGQVGNDYLNGGSGDDYLSGDTSQSSNPDYYTLPQYHGNDTLEGGKGNDYLIGDTDTTQQFMRSTGKNVKKRNPLFSWQPVQAANDANRRQAA